MTAVINHNSDATVALRWRTLLTVGV